MSEEISQERQSIHMRIGKRERILFTLLLISTIVTVCGLIVALFTLGIIGLVLLLAVLVLLGILWTWQLVRVMTIRTDGILLSEQQQSLVYAQLRQDAERLGFWKVPEVFVTHHKTIQRPRTIGVFQKYLVVLPANDPMDGTTRFELIRELVHLKQNHKEKQLLLVLGSWIPFLRSAYIRACEETADRTALACLPEEERVPALVRTIVGPLSWSRLNMTAYVEQKRQPVSIAATISDLFRHQSSASRRLTFAGLETVPSHRGRIVRGLLVSLSSLALAGFLFFVTQAEWPQWLTDWSDGVEQQLGAEEDLGETKLMAAIQKGTLEEIKMLIPKSDMTAVDADGDTALHYLGYRKSSKGLEEVFKALLAAGSDVDAVNDFGERPFITAVYSNNDELVELYLKRGEDINQQDDEAYTPLHHAVEGEGKQTVKLLIEKGADRSLKNSDGYTPLMLAEEYELDDIIVLLKQNQTQTL